MNRTTRLLHGLVRTYRASRKGRLSPCRYFPSCSAYMLEALEKYGALKGTWMGAKRLLRCHPLGSHGFDPVPSRKIGTDANV